MCEIAYGDVLREIAHVAFAGAVYYRQGAYVAEGIGRLVVEGEVAFDSRNAVGRCDGEGAACDEIVGGGGVGVFDNVRVFFIDIDGVFGMRSVGVGGVGAVSEGGEVGVGGKNGVEIEANDIAGAGVVFVHVVPAE